ncbi:class I SAM-dependent methyltransferase [Reinekea marinisedimentorum]|uniref:Ribosomal RNA small subunit methyltransferase J n=1 Tax=Reinekea marinisedimentorum TaxID=230495 RepID=A0A4R3I804_9GAMM|nr:class I SAM-dependent methyltransferase [Reinekea marinisedimentorum]TCS41352.1 16S rRNA (guanine1516-N2)-methyltransferase [Reinekea marinisedimentorum]
MFTIPLYCPDEGPEQNRLLLEQCKKESWLQISSVKPNQAFIVIEDGKLGLAGSSWPKVHAVFVDFLSAAAEHRRLHGGGAGQAVAKAVGLKKRKDIHILDATAGLGRDAFVMASLGATVHMLERNQVVHLLLNDGLQRLKDSGQLDEVADRMTLSAGSLLEPDACATLKQFDVVYLDPMFPDRSKSAKVKKDMALFHDMIGADMDADELLNPAMALAEYRVVVKRSKKAPLLMNREPSTQLLGKSSRFDIYAIKSLSVT